MQSRNTPRLLLRNAYAERNVFLVYFIGEAYYSRKMDWMLEFKVNHIKVNHSLIVTFCIDPTRGLRSLVLIKYS